MKLAIFALVLVFGSLVSAMDKCPVEFGNDDYLGKVIQLVEASDSCWAASEVARACALGATGDIYTVGATILKCEKELPVMSASDSAMYKNLNEKCTEKYSKLQGSLYRSANAFCHLSVTRLFIDLLSEE